MTFDNVSAIINAYLTKIKKRDPVIMKRFWQYALNFILSLVFHWYWCIPAIILLICHFVFGISVWWSVGAFVLYVIGVRIFVHAVGWLVRAGNEDEKPQKNKNPYSVRIKKYAETLDIYTAGTGNAHPDNKRKNKERKNENTAENKKTYSIKIRDNNDIR